MQVLKAASEAFSAEPLLYSTDLVKLTILRTKNIPATDKLLNVVVTQGTVTQSTTRTGFDKDDDSFKYGLRLNSPSMFCGASALVFKINHIF